MKIAFHISNYSYRGTEVSSFDYALGNRDILGNESIIVSPKVRKLQDNIEVMNRFIKTLGNIYFYNTKESLEQYCIDTKIDAIYVIKYGKKDEFEWKIPTLVHCAFFMNEKHGSVYAGVSESVAKGLYPYVPHIITLPNDPKNFRQRLGIPDNAIVFGRHGGSDTFDIPFVKDVILKVLKERNDIYFIFAVQPDMLKDIKDINHKNLINIEVMVDPIIKRRFINTTDAMIHSSSLGESFGISVLEFSFCNKPVITFNGGQWHTQHLTNLGDKAILYNNANELYDIVINFKKNDYVNKDWNVTDRFTAEKVMKQFNEVFLKLL